MKAVVLKSDGTLHYTDVPKPDLAHGEVLVKVKACGICGSDLRYLEGENPWSQQTLGYKAENPDNLILGHEFAGDVVEVADEKDRDLIGKKVAVIVYKTCGVCENCRTNHPNLCKNTMHIGHGAGWREMEYYPGGMADYCQVWSDKVVPFENLTYEEACTLDFVAVALAAVRKANKIFAEDAVIIGTGPVGIMAAQLLKVSGARKVICVDTLSYSFQAAKECGADRTILMGSDTESAIKAETEGMGASIVIDTVGEPETQRLAFDICKVKGTVINVVCNDTVVDAQLFDLYGEKSIVSVANAADAYFYDCLKMLEAGRITVKPLLTNIIPLSEVNEGMDMLFHREKSGAIKVVLKPEETEQC